MSTDLLLLLSKMKENHAAVVEHHHVARAGTIRLRRYVAGIPAQLPRPSAPRGIPHVPTLRPGAVTGGQKWGMIVPKRHVCGTEARCLSGSGAAPPRCLIFVRAGVGCVCVCVVQCAQKLHKKRDEDV